MKKVKTITAIIAMVLSISMFAQIPSSADDCVGKYWSPDKDAHIDIYKKADKYFGKISWAKNPRKDTENPDVSLRTRDIVGMEFLIGFNFDGKDTWEKGYIYDAKKGKTYKCTMWLDKDKNLNVHGYVGFSLLGRTAVFWKRTS
jgi:uncharacterized protein (DUF2147 family)